MDSSDGLVDSTVYRAYENYRAWIILWTKSWRTGRDGLYVYNCMGGGVKSREEKVSLDGGSLWTQGGMLDDADN
jgi:hypothetical protein